MRREKIVRISIGILLAVLIMTPIVYVQANKLIYAHRVTAYLLEDGHYRKEEIQSVRGIWGIKLPSFFAVVTFKDEPHVEYVYFAHNEVHQFGYRLTPEGRDHDFKEKDLKHYVPF
ncbi:DUF3139 domain-containing protein [Paenibacillus sp. CGMCC 1.18879]|nr:DUF3139 domain-containing protein [Paenibacillus sp. CGMCC 1.18879]